MKTFGRIAYASVLSFVLLTIILVLLTGQHTVKGNNAAWPPSETRVDQQITVTILVDDFAPQPMQGQPFWWFNRLGGGSRGGICKNPDENRICRNIDWGRGTVTATITAGTDEAGVWTSLNHPLDDATPLNFSAIFPRQITPTLQGQITGLHIQIATGTGTFHVELKCEKAASCAQTPDVSPQLPNVKWRSENVTLTGGPLALSFGLPPTLTEITNLNWVVMGSVGSFVAVDRVELTATMPYMDTPQRAFLWSYAQLLSNWHPESGLTRDQAYFAANQFDNISASGLQAAAAVMAWQLGFISEAAANEIVSKTTQGMLSVPRDNQCGSGGSRLWPHFVDHGQIVSGTEWSSIDTVIATMALLEAQEALGLDTTGVISVLQGINWDTLILPNGSISHGYLSNCDLIELDWKPFGLESWIVNLGYAAATGKTAEFDHTPPTWNGGGFVDELAWLLVPPSCPDRWGTDWCAYSQQAVGHQLAYYRCQEAEANGYCRYNHWCRELDANCSCSCCRDHRCYGELGLFGLTPNEVPDLSLIPSTATRNYLDFGICGQASCMDGTDPVTIPGKTSPLVVSLGHAVIVPHYAGVIASLRPTQAISLWNWLEEHKLLTPLNNAESLMVTEEPTNCNQITGNQIAWNARKGSWELGLQTLGWGRYLARDDHPLYQAMRANDMLRRGYEFMSSALEVSKEANADSVQPGAQLTYTIRVTNTGSVTLTAIITDMLPTHVTLDETSGVTSALPRDVVVITWTAVITAPSDVRIETVSVTVEEGYKGPLPNVVEVTTEEGAAGKAYLVVNPYKIHLPRMLMNYPQVAFLTNHGYYVTATDVKNCWVLRGAATKLGDCEKFTLIHLNDGRVALKTCHGRYVTATNAERDWVLIAETTELKDWEKFILISLGPDDDRIALQTYHGKYVTAMNAERDWVLRAETTELRDWEKFVVIPQW